MVDGLPLGRGLVVGHTEEMEGRTGSARSGRRAAEAAEQKGEGEPRVRFHASKIGPSRDHGQALSPAQARPIHSRSQAGGRGSIPVPKQNPVMWKMSGAAKQSESMRSRNPPWPAMEPPQSFAPRSRLIAERTSPPKNPARQISRAMRAACQGVKGVAHHSRVATRTALAMPPTVPSQVLCGLTRGATGCFSAGLAHTYWRTSLSWTVRTKKKSSFAFFPVIAADRQAQDHRHVADGVDADQQRPLDARGVGEEVPHLSGENPSEGNEDEGIDRDEDGEHAVPADPHEQVVQWQDHEEGPEEDLVVGPFGFLSG